jgi:hypothetical protein
MNDNYRKPAWRAAAMILVALAAAVTLTLWMCRYSRGGSERALFWGIVIPWSVAARIPGALIGDCLGLVARHAVGWFAAVLAGAASILILNFLQEPDPLVMLARLRTNLMPAAVIFGMLSATIAETSLSMLEMLWPAQRNTESGAQAHSIK